MKAWKLLVVFSLACLLAVSFLSCDEGSDEEDTRGGIYSPAGDDDADAGDDDTEQINDDVEDDDLADCVDDDDMWTDDPRCVYPADDAEYNVIECEGREEIFELYPCWDLFDIYDCVDDYEYLLNRCFIVEESNPISFDEGLERINEIRRGDVVAYSPDEYPGISEFKRHLESIINLNVLFDNFNKRALFVDKVSEEIVDNYTSSVLLITDPIVGSFDAKLLMPNEPSGQGTSFPIIIAIHGHGENAEDYYSNNPIVSDLVEKGYAFLAYSRKASGAGPSEDFFSKGYFLSGFSALGIRRYENRIIEKLISYWGSKNNSMIDKNRIGGIGHSGGSAIGNLLLRIDETFEAFVSDFAGSYLGIEPDFPFDDFYLLDTSHPDVFLWNLLIRDFATLDSAKVLSVPYGYYNYGPELGGRDTIQFLPGQEPEVLRSADEIGPVDDLILEFFDEHLKGT